MSRYPLLLALLALLVWGAACGGSPAGPKAQSVFSTLLVSNYAHEWCYLQGAPPSCPWPAPPVDSFLIVMGHGDTARAVAMVPFDSTVCVQLQFPASATAGFGGQVKTILQGPSLWMFAMSTTQNGPTWLTYYITPSNTLIDFSTAPGWALDLRDSTAKSHLDGYDVFPRINFGPTTAACPNPRPMWPG